MSVLSREMMPTNPTNIHCCRETIIRLHVNSAIRKRTLCSFKGTLCQGKMFVFLRTPQLKFE